jgi:ATP-dependent helicase/nuclease subunit B
MAEPRAHPRVFSVPPGAPFLKVLADALLSGGLVAFDHRDPLALAGVTVLLPTRRSVRAFSDVLIERLGGEAAILPVIRPIGDVDEDEQLLDPFIGKGEDRLALPPAISPLARRLALTRLTLAWATQLRRHPLGLSPDEPLRIPASAADATRLAADLARLIDEVAINNVDWNKLATLVPDDHAKYFQLTLGFLKIVSEAWPQYLGDNNRADPASRRDGLIRSAAARLKRQGGPIVAAGSTGSIPATAELLRVIATLPNGVVVLPGLDAHLDAAGWNAIGSDEAAEAATHGHPQFALKQLIATIGVAREDVVPLGAASQESVARTALLSEAMRPADTLDAWAGVRPAPDALAGLALVVARNEQEEATSIALAIREGVETAGATAALVTPDRTLARRVAVELGRWGLAIDDSAGARLDREPHGVFARLLAEAAASSADPVKLLALLKHPFAAFGMARPLCREAARHLEVALFRGHRVPGGVSGLSAALAAARVGKDTKSRIPAARRRLRDHEWDLAARLVEAVAACLAPLEAAVDRGATAATAATLLRDALTKAATDETGTDDALWQKEGGLALAVLLDELADAAEGKSLTLGPGDFPFFLAALLGEVQVPRRPGADPRIHIWGTLEARLQSVDLLVLGGLDEGVWPAVPRTDPWLSRTMRAALGLPAPERRLGQAAHDFVQGMTASRVIVTRAEKRDGAPTVESRWLQRLRALIGRDRSEAIAARGRRFVDLARQLDQVDGKPAPMPRPAPRPPLAARPKGLSITDIETLIRDPYAIYAKRVLRLEPLDPLGLAPDRALRGSLIHAALGNFTGAWTGAFDRAAEERLLAVGRDVLAAIEDFPDIHSVWSIRFAAIARWFVAWEAARSAAVATRHAEIEGALELPTAAGPFRLRGRADRIDVMRDGSLAIYDFKTGTPQTEKTVFAGLTPQMTLEAAMARAGGFAGIPAGRIVSDLAWLAVGKVGRADPYVSAVGRQQKLTADQLADRAHQMLRGLIDAFADIEHPYLSRARPMMERARYLGDYDHLARVREWALVESAEDVL